MAAPFKPGTILQPEVLDRWAREGRPTAEDGRRFAEGALQGRVSKFQACLPAGLLIDLLVGKLLDVQGARRAVAVAMTTNEMRREP